MFVVTRARFSRTKFKFETLIAPNVRFRDSNFQNFPGEHAPGPPSVLALPALDPLSAASTLNCFYRSCSDAENGKIEID